MSTNVVGVKLHSSGWWGSNRNSAGGRDRLERARHSGAGGEPAGAVDRVVGDRVIGVERVGVGVGDEHVGRELADPVGDQTEAVAVDLERVVAEVEAVERRAERGRGALGLAVADLLDVLDRLVLLLPQLAGLAALAVGERDHGGLPAAEGRDRDRPAGAPHEVGRVRADHHHPAAHDRLHPRHDARVHDGHHVHLLLLEAGVEQPVDHQRHPVLDRRVEHLPEIGREHRVLRPESRMFAQPCAPTRPCRCGAW